MDHVEILKGPSGLFIGTGSPAGSVNMRLKQADRVDPGGYITATANSFGSARFEGDIGGALNADGTVRGRAVLAYGDGDGAIDKQKNGVKQLYGALAWDISPSTTATFSVSHMERDIAPYNGLPTYSDGTLLWLDADTTTAADWNTFSNSVTDAIVAVEHEFDTGARVKFSLRDSQQDTDFLYAYASSAAAADNTVNGLRWLARDFSQESLAVDAHAELPFTLGTWDATAIVGVDAQKTTATTYQDRGQISGTYDLDNWDVSGVAKPNVDYFGSSTATRTRTETTSTGVYGQLRVKPTQALTVIGGARLSWYDSDSTNLITNTTTNSSENGHVTPFAGVTYDVTPSTTIYASYSEIFQPQTDLDINGKTLDPLEGQQFELGVKAELAYGVNVSAAAYQLEQVNRALSSTDGSYSIAQGEIRVRGIELEAAGEIGPNLHLSGGYTYAQSEYLNGPDEGDVFSTYTPRNILKLSLMYDVPQGALEGWSFGGHLRAMSGFSSVSQGITINAPGYGLVDLTAKKTLTNGVDLQFGVDNVLDKAYYSRVGGTSVFNFRGEERSYSIAMTKRF
ncbi:TonB-dependent siderophore receptor [Thioclava sp. SK-1]|uniref:TonB-dependent siderophore receptor n=1 Tax=Thioclava sp. SK-1 TaxID=1889770 RepID=UPI002100C123|nr:TonB-dependent siderophore receptor [Thioclava sp. SK-1]